MKDVLVPLPPAGLIDRLASLRSQVDAAVDPVTRTSLAKQRDAMQAVLDRLLPHDSMLHGLVDQLYALRCDLRSVEQDLRKCEAQADFGPGFIALTRTCLALLDERDQLASRIAIHLSHTPLAQDPE